MRYSLENVGDRSEASRDEFESRWDFPEYAAEDQNDPEESHPIADNE